MSLKLYLTRSKISKKLTHQRLKNRVPFLQTQRKKKYFRLTRNKKSVKIFVHGRTSEGRFFNPLQYRQGDCVQTKSKEQT